MKNYSYFNYKVVKITINEVTYIASFEDKTEEMFCVYFPMRVSDNRNNCSMACSFKKWITNVEYCTDKEYAEWKKAAEAYAWKTKLDKGYCCYDDVPEASERCCDDNE